GRLAEVISPEGKTQYAYDKSGRLTGIFSPDGTSQRTGYDERGRVNVTTQGRRAIEYHYPDEHTVIRCIQPPEDERDRHPDESLLKTTYRYNAAGELTEVILPGDETLTFSRDEAGREVFRHSNRGFACEQGWNAASQRAGLFPEETTWGGLLPSLVREYRYDSAGNVSGVTSREDYGRETRREYRLDRNGQVTAVTASGTGLGYGEGDESYGYDSCGYLKAQSAGRHRISEETDQYAGGHRLKQAGNTQYDYDAAGRMVSRTKHRDGYRPETERFRWDSRDQLTGYCSAQGELWEYRHDASGRRTEKRCDRKKIRFTYLWDGDSIAEIREYRDDKLYSVRHLVFNGFELISQQFSRERQAHPSVAPLWVTRTNHAVSDLTGRPLMLFNSEGKTVWRPGQTSLWGLALSLPADTGYPDPRGELDPEAAPGLLYAGQWQDTESGLCYNRFRYYEPETGMYLVSDPLGLQGGEQTYRYVPNPLGYVDPLGLAVCPKLYEIYKGLRAQGFNPAEARDLAKWFNSSWGKADVYLRSAIGSGKIDYVGISRNVLNRYPQGKYDLELLTRLTGQLPRNQARAIEQAIINAKRGNGFTNIQNSIDPAKDHFDAAVKWGEEWLKSNGFGGWLQ
ncbi:RHS repeat domain-containing protein, partial [Escherichia coli]|uniref:RHS repeat domain-containing protein n=1 Tax=Escherichia coli TaxID=562 RepID=UPI000BE19023